MIHRVNDQLPPPSGPPQPGPVPPAPPVAYPAYPSYPAAPPETAPGQQGQQWQQPSGQVSPMPPAPVVSRPLTPMPGTNGLAIAALCCSIVGMVPLASIVGIVLGIVALNQLRERIQRGRGMAVAGIVIGSLWLVGWVLFIVAVADDPAASDTGSRVVAGRTADVRDLGAGDCFDIPDPASDHLDRVTVRSCDAPHQAQVGAVVTLPAGDYPGDDEVVDLADRTCGEKLEPLMRASAFGSLELSFIYPDSSFAWRMDRSAICILEGRSGATTGSALR